MSQGKATEKGNFMLVAIGGNAASQAGNPRETVLAGLAALRAVFADVKVSRLYQTPAFPAGSGPDFINAACAFHSVLPARSVLDHLHAIEAEFGRTRTLRWGQRTLDLDLIACGQTIAPDLATFIHWRDMDPADQKTRTPGELILPHPRLQDRAFVLVPLADVAADWTHPVLGRTVTQLRDDLGAGARAEITALA